jgi:hypothetical protein
MINVLWRYVFVLLSALGGISVVTIAVLGPDLKKGRYSLSHPRPGQLVFGLSSMDAHVSTLSVRACSSQE